MKMASTFLQILALSACFTAQAHGTFTMPGVRQALRTIDCSNAQSALPITASIDCLNDLPGLLDGKSRDGTAGTVGVGPTKGALKTAGTLAAASPPEGSGAPKYRADAAC